MHQEMVFFCRTFLAGVFLAVCYDMLRIFRKLAVHNTFFTGVEDILYWCLAGLFLFSVIYGENDGIIRIYALFSIGLGAGLYHAGPSNLLVEWCTLILKKMLFLVGIPARPIRKWRKRLKFQVDRVMITLSEKKSTRRIRKRVYEDIRNQKQKKIKEKENKKGKSAE